MKQYLMIGAVVAVVAAIIIAAIGLGLFAGEETNAFKGTATIYIEPEGSDEAMKADIDISSPSWGEARMLDFGQGIRTTQFKPLAVDPGTTQNVATPSISQWGTYKIWGVVDLTVTGTADIAALNSVKVYFYGYAGNDMGNTGTTPNHATSSDQLACADGTGTPTLVKTSGVSLGSSIVFDQSQFAGGAFAQHYSTSYQPLYGAAVDGTRLTCNIEAKVTDGHGAQTTKTVKVDMSIQVGAWSASYVTITINSITAKVGT